jgi:hypothetical protein
MKVMYAGDAVLRGRGDEREAADHGAVDDVIQFAQRRGGTLALRTLKI